MAHEDVSEFVSLTKETAPEVKPKRAAVDHEQVGFKEKEKSAEPVAKDAAWVKAGDYYLPAGRSFETLPPGVYQPVVTQSGIAWQTHELHNDELYRFPDTKSTEVVDSISKFWQSRERFKSMGQLYKRGIILWGPPGSGKTVTVNLLMEELVKRGGLVLLVNDPRYAPQALRDLRKIEPERPIICVLEDLDALISGYGETTLLSLLDGEAQVDNVVYVATTNYPERLDGRIVNRPSRFDEVIKIGMPVPAARRAYIHAKAPSLTEAELDKWVNDTDGFSIAHIRELVIAVYCLDRKYEDTLGRLKAMSQKVSSSQAETKKSGFGFA